MSDKSNKVHHGKNISRFRRIKELTQDDLAGGLKVSRVTIANWEKEEVLSKEIIIKCADFLKIDSWYIEFATIEDVLAKFAYNDIGVVAEDGSNVIDTIYNHPLDAVLAMHREEKADLRKDIEVLQERNKELEEKYHQLLLKQIEELKNNKDE